jgi:hypothetical protein
VSGPDKDGEIEIDSGEKMDGFVWLTEADLQMMLRRIKRGRG